MKVTKDSFGNFNRWRHFEKFTFGNKKGPRSLAQVRVSLESYEEIPAKRGVACLSRQSCSRERRQQAVLVGTQAAVNLQTEPNGSTFDACRYEITSLSIQKLNCTVAAQLSRSFSIKYGGVPRSGCYVFLLPGVLLVSKYLDLCGQ